MVRMWCTVCSQRWRQYLMSNGNFAHGDHFTMSGTVTPRVLGIVESFGEDFSIFDNEGTKRICVTGVHALVGLVDELLHEVCGVVRHEMIVTNID